MNYIKQDLLTVEEGIIAHGCNAQGVMGGGIALLLKNKYPTLYLKYRSQYLECRRNQMNVPMGSLSYDKLSDTLYGVNLITQDRYKGFNGINQNKRWVSYDAIEDSLNNLIGEFCQGNLGNIPVVYVPLIGAGLGGGNWDVISSIIETTFSVVDMEINICIID